MGNKKNDQKFLDWMRKLDPGCDLTEETLKKYRTPEYRREKAKRLREPMRLSQSKPVLKEQAKAEKPSNRREVWKKPVRFNTRGKRAIIYEGGKCSPK